MDGVCAAVAVASLIVALVLAFFLHKCRKGSSCSPFVASVPPSKNIQGHGVCKSGDVCICQMERRKTCINRDAQDKAYEAGRTEYQDFSEEQRKAGGPFWKNTDFSIY